ncbi:MAG: VIT and vWA domain-containing protein [Alcanivoracaceae bacterium]
MSSKPSRDPLQQVRFDVRVTALATEVLQYQLYRNHGSKPIEAVYTFPVPLHATLLGATVVTEGRELRLEVKANARAERDYEEALADGKAAYRIEQSRPGLYTLSAGNLAPGQQAELHLRWALLNRWHGDRLALRLPTTLTERYGDAGAVGVSGAAMPHNSIFVDRRCDVAIDLDSTLGNVRWECASHTLQASALDHGLRLQGSGIAMDRDIVLVLHRAAAQSRFMVLPDGNDWMAIAQLHSAAKPVFTPRHLIMVLDCSGSMMGSSIEQARAGAMALLDWLRPEQRVNLIRFGSGHEALFDTPRAADDDTLQQLHQRILQTQANMGGTKIDAALQAAMRQAQQCEGDADILLLTDGAIWETEKALAGMNGSTRVFTIGVGFAANEEVIGRLAKRGRGHCEVVSPTENVAEAVRRQYQRICSGEPLTASASWPAASEQWPPQAEVYPGDAAFLFARGTGPKPDSLAIAISGKQGCERIILPTEQNATLGNDTLVRLAAAENLHQIANAHERQEFAIRYQLVCDGTSLIVVDEAVQVQGMPEVVPVEHMVVAGAYGLSSSGIDLLSMNMFMPESSLYFDAANIEEPQESSQLDIVDQDQPMTADKKRPDIHALFQTCREIISEKGIAHLSLSLLAGSYFPDALIGQLSLLTPTYQEHKVLGALLLALAGRDPSLDVPRSLSEYQLDDALIAAVLRLVREHHAELFYEHAEMARP